MSDHEPVELAGAPPPEPTRKVRADTLERATRAWSTRVMGGTWRQAAEVSGYSDPNNCSRAVKSVFGELPEPEREELRHLWRDRLEFLWRTVAKDAADRVPGATTAGVRVASAAAKLDGLDEPQRFDMSPTYEALEAWVSQVSGAARKVELLEADPLDAEVEDD